MEKAEKEREQKLSFRFVLTRLVMENSKTIAKKFKKLKNSFMASFLAKIGWKRLRKRENETIASFHPYPIRNKKTPKKEQKN